MDWLFISWRVMEACTTGLLKEWPWRWPSKPSSRWKVCSYFIVHCHSAQTRQAKYYHRDPVYYSLQQNHSFWRDCRDIEACMAGTRRDPGAGLPNPQSLEGNTDSAISWLRPHHTGCTLNRSRSVERPALSTIHLQ